MKEKYNWLEILKLVLDELPLSQTVNYKNKEFRFKYIGDKETRIGYLLIWESSTSRAVQISRVKAPEKIPMIDFKDSESFKEQIPEQLSFEALTK